VEPELEALDDAMETLASLHTGSTSRGRRGRIDLAALLWEVAPNARVSIEPGSGTEVFGDETELRRMFQVLVGSTSPASDTSQMGTPELAIRREGSEIRVSVTLGPDSSANAETERAWLSRMAVRYGGRFELEGGTESILLPAEGATDQREMEALRRELEAAQRQGEAYARELAAAFPYEPTPPPRFTSRPADAANAVLAGVAALAANASRQLRALHGALTREVGTKGQRGESATGGNALLQLEDVAVDLERLGQCPSYESAEHVNLADTVRGALAELNARASRQKVALRSQIPPHADVMTRPIAAAVLVRILLGEAIAATPAGSEVRVQVEPTEEGQRLVIEDGGAPISADSFALLMSNPSESGKSERAVTAALPCAQLLAQHIHVDLQVAPRSPQGGGAGVQLALHFTRA
jgi:signal transduction histidine kinase